MATYKHKVGNMGGSFDIDADLDNMQLSIKDLPDIHFDEIKFNVTNLPRIEFDEIISKISIEKLPTVVIDADTRSTLDIAIKEIPDVRAHLPSHYNLGISIFGIEVVNFSLCGESQVITEKYQQRRMEICR
jgi:hypothetical protein